MTLNKNKPGGAVLYILAAILLIILMDLCLGGASAWFYHRSKYGIFHRQQYVLNESQDDIIILGSSRASHHYVPSVITDSLGMSCYNAGSEGMCVFYHYALLASMIERGHCPKVVIYDVVDYDTREYPGPTFTLEAALDRLAPHYGEYACIDSLFLLKGWKEKIKMMFLSYRYNSKMVQSIKCNFIPLEEDGGYEKVEGTLPDNVSFETVEYDNCSLDSLKILYIQKMIDLTKRNHIKMVFVQSPYYMDKPSRALDFFKDIVIENHMVYLDCSNDTAMMQRELFKDVMHLNDAGAHAWTIYFTKYLKSIVDN